MPRGKGVNIMTKQVSLLVNDVPINVDYFVSGFIDHTVDGMLRALRGIGEIGELDLAIEQDSQVTIKLNNAQVPTNPFVSKIMRNTILGMLSSLREVSEISTVRIVIKH